MADLDKNKPKGIVLVVGGTTQQRNEISLHLKSFYRIKVCDDYHQIMDILAKGTPTALVVDETLPPKGGAPFSLKSVKWQAKRISRLFSQRRLKIQRWLRKQLRIITYFFVKRPFAPSTFISALSSGVTASTEAKWDDIEPIQQAALKNSLNSFNSVAGLIQDGSPIPYDDVRDSCAPLIEAVQNNNCGCAR